MSKLLVIRFSAFGDVAMCIPVLYSFAGQHPDLSIYFLSRKGFEGLFQNKPENLFFMGIDLNEYKGIAGLQSLYEKLKQEDFDYVADFHGVLRSNFLRFRFKLNGVKTALIDKGRKEKQALTRKNAKVFRALESSFTRYKKVLEALGFEFEINFESIYQTAKPDYEKLLEKTGEKTEKWIGIAPFAKHEGKTYPIGQMENVAAHFSKIKDVKIFLFGGGKTEQELLAKWQNRYPNIFSYVGQLSLEQELQLISLMDVMLTMDSANMHLASLVATKVVSVWGATHPFAGFLGWHQSVDNLIQIDLSCRPCSVFGNKACFRGDYACMREISPEMIIQKIETLLS